MATWDEVEARLDRIARLYHKLDELIDKLPVDLPDWMREQIKKTLLNNQDMAELVDGIEHRRPPRFVLVGRTGVGKSSLINAMCGRYLAEVSDVEVGTKLAERFHYTSLGKTLFEVIDTRGIAESEGIDPEPAEKALLAAIGEFKPDAVLFLTRCKERAHLDKDVSFVRSITSGRDGEIPVVVLLAQADEMEPSRPKDPREYSEKKQANINDAVGKVKRILDQMDVSPLAVLPVSAYIEWSDDPKKLDSNEWQRMSIKFDGRFKIDELLDLLEANIDIRAGIFLMMVARLDKVTRKICRKLTMIFASAAAAIGANPIPISDIYILLALQALLIMLIAYLAGHDISLKTAMKLMVSLGGAGVVGIALRALAQQGSKLLNIVFPGAGSAVSAGVAGAATYGMGRAAIAYYLDGASPESLREEFERGKQEFDGDDA